MDEVEQTLHICREVKVYRIPPRSGAAGYRSGEWRVADELWQGRLRVLGRGACIDIRLEDVHTGDLFALCPIRPGTPREVSVEPTADSSRYFVLRVEDPTTKRHAFLGLGFAERGAAFDFSASLSDYERQLQREKAVEAAAGSGAAAQAAAGAAPRGADAAAVAALYRDHGDLSLKEGQTIRVNVKVPSGGKQGGGLTARAADGAALPGLSRPGTSGSALAPLAPPPAVAHPATGAQAAAVGPHAGALQPPPAMPVASSDDGWATFD